MRLLLDTHAFLWWLTLDDAMNPQAADAIADPEQHRVRQRGKDAFGSAPTFKL